MGAGVEEGSEAQACNMGTQCAVNGCSEEESHSKDSRMAARLTEYRYIVSESVGGCVG